MAIKVVFNRTDNMIDEMIMVYESSRSSIH